jgi:hypothetical protein
LGCDCLGLAIQLVFASSTEHRLQWPPQQAAEQAGNISLTPRQYVQVQVRHGLMGGAAVVDHEMHAIAAQFGRAPQRCSDSIADFQQMRAQFGWQFIQMLTVHLGQHQHVTRPQWGDVHDRKTIFVFIGAATG